MVRLTLVLWRGCGWARCVGAYLQPGILGLKVFRFDPPLAFSLLRPRRSSSGGRRAPWTPRPVSGGGCVNGYSHLLNGDFEA
eukprot:3886192-Prymnesium_polylepis.1